MSVNDNSRCSKLQAGNAQGLVHYEFIPKGRTVKKEMYVKILCYIRDAARRQRPEE
jgi:hypothetical protein